MQADHRVGGGVGDRCSIVAQEHADEHAGGHATPMGPRRAALALRPRTQALALGLHGGAHLVEVGDRRRGRCRRLGSQQAGQTVGHRFVEHRRVGGRQALALRLHCRHALAQ
jgi:hypothetical protein